MNADRAIPEFHDAQGGPLVSLGRPAPISVENARLCRALAERDAKIRRLVDANIIGIIVWNIDGDILEVNDAFLRMVGYAREELISAGVRWLDLMLPEWRESTEHAVEQLKANGSTQPTEKECIRKDGSRVPVKVGRAAFGPKGHEGLAFVVDLTDLKESERRGRESCEMLRALTARRETAREEERKYIAREMHDELGQHLTALRMQASLLQNKLGSNRADLIEETTSMIALIDETMQVVRGVIASLRPAALEAGIVAALEWLSAEFNRNGRTVCRLCVDDENIVMSEKHATVLFRVVQEALTNVMRHAAANSVAITLKQTSQGCAIEVRDDGRGFDVLATRKHSYGLVGIEERVSMLGGELDIVSSPGSGTSLKVKLHSHKSPQVAPAAVHGLGRCLLDGAIPAKA